MGPAASLRMWPTPSPDMRSAGCGWNRFLPRLLPRLLSLLMHSLQPSRSRESHRHHRVGGGAHVAPFCSHQCRWRPAGVRAKIPHMGKCSCCDLSSGVAPTQKGSATPLLGLPVLPFVQRPRSELDLHVTDPRTPAALAEDFFHQLLPANGVQYVSWDFMLV